MKTIIRFSELLDIISEDSKWICNNPTIELHGIKRVTKSSEPPFIGDILYVCNLSDYRKLMQYNISNMIVYAKDRESALDIDSYNNLIVVYNRSVLDAVTDCIENILSNQCKLSSIGRTIQLFSAGKDSLKTVLQYAFELLSNPIFVTDISFKVIAKIGTTAINDEPYWQFASEQGFFSQTYIDAVMHGVDNVFNNEVSFELLFDDKDSIGMTHNQLSSKLIYGGRMIGYFKVLEYNRSFNGLDRELIPLIAKYLSPVVATNHNIIFSSSLNEDFFLSVLDGELTQPEDIQSRQESFGIKLYPVLHILSVNMPLSVLNSDRVHYIANRLKNMFDRNNIVLYNNNIVVLYDSKDEYNYIPEDTMNNFRKLISEYGCSVGISAPFYNLYQMPRHYRQAQMTYHLSKILHLDDSIFFYQDLIDYHMILNFSEEQNLENLLHPAAVKLRKYDSENNSNLLDTLFSYVGNHCNLMSTSKAMYIHYNTLKYRIDKIADMTGIDYSNENDVFRILLSKRVYEMIEKMSV